MSICKRAIEYAGVANPTTPDEMRIEILGLRNAIRQAEELISRHEQAMEIAAYMRRLAAVGPEETQNAIEGEADIRTPEGTQAEPSGPPLVR